MMEFFFAYPLYIQIGLSVLAVTFIIELCYYIWFSTIRGHRHNRKGEAADPGPISVVVVIDNDFTYVEDYLPLLLSQNYPADFEIIAVNDCSSEPMGDLLEEMERKYDNLRISTIRPDPMFKHSRKLAINVGIKAARYENIMIVGADCYPSSDRWLYMMARGFDRGEIVIGYTGIEMGKGFINKLIRAERLFIGMRYLAKAVHGKPYRGIYNNMGISRPLYMRSRGFNHQRMHIGDDDLYIQSISKNAYSSVIINPGATMRQFQAGGWGWWRKYMNYRSASFKYYKAGIKLYVSGELFSRFMLFASAGVLFASGDMIMSIVAASVLVLRWIVVLYIVSGICRRVGERGIVKVFVIYDIISILSELTLSVRRRLFPSKEIWIQ